MQLLRDRADELLPSLSGLLKKDAAVVSAAVAVVQILCKEEVRLFRTLLLLKI